MLKTGIEYDHREYCVIVKCADRKIAENYKIPAKYDKTHFLVKDMKYEDEETGKVTIVIGVKETLFDDKHPFYRLLQVKPNVE